MSEVAINMNKFKPERSTGEYKGEIWGCIENGYVVMLSNVFSRMCERGNFSSKSFLNWANRQGYLQTDKGRNSKKKRLEGSLSWCVFLKIQDDSIDADDFMQVTEDMQEQLPFD
jgi:hypothetical protein